MLVRVAMVTTRCFPFMGGIETHVHEVAPRLAALGVEVKVLTLRLEAELPHEERLGEVTIQRFESFPRVHDYAIAPALLGELRRGRYDLVHVQGVHTMLPPLALAAAARAGVPSVLTFHTGGHSSPWRSRVRTAQWRAEAPILRRAERLVAVCEFERRLFGRALGYPMERIALVRNGSEPLPQTAASSPIAGSPLILSIGRLERYKGHHRVVAAMPSLLRQAPGARLAIVGAGPYEAELRRLIARLGLSRVVELVSFPPAQRAELGALVRAADVVALLSEYEAHPVAVMEALALGRDVVVADTSGLRELAEGGLVQAIPVDAEPKQVAAALLDAIAEQRWRQQVPRINTWDDCARELRGVYDEVLACAS